jgi:hypothetical protein
VCYADNLGKTGKKILKNTIPKGMEIFFKFPEGVFLQGFSPGCLTLQREPSKQLTRPTFSGLLDVAPERRHFKRLPIDSKKVTERLREFKESSEL